MKEPSLSWQDFRTSASDLHWGTEHGVDFALGSARVAKITIPPGFGLTPQVISSPRANLRGDPEVPAFRQAVEFVLASPLEYLERWQAANEVFGDDVRLGSVIRWRDGLVSFAITQPQYHGEPASEHEIERYFAAAGWTWIPDSSGHQLFFNYAYGTLAIDAMPRNCYVNEGVFPPFDVILCQPDEELTSFLGLYPD